MYKKIELQDLDIPQDDIDCWNRYPKHNWVYDSSRLLEKQQVQWAPFKTDLLDTSIPAFILHSAANIGYNSANIYIQESQGDQTLAEAYIVKGELKYLRLFDTTSLEEINECRGYVNLKINAFVSLYFQKFTGVISAELVGNVIYRMSLKPLSHLGITQNAETSKLIKRIYKKTDLVHLNGLTDQKLHETIAS